MTSIALEAFKLQLCQDIRNAVIGRRDAQPTYGVSPKLIELWLTQFDRGKLNDEEAEASVIAKYEAHIAVLERKVTPSDRTGPGPVTMEEFPLSPAVSRRGVF